MEEKYTNYINIYISDDNMNGDIFLAVPPEPDFYVADEVIEYVKDHKIVEGINRDVIEEAINTSHYCEFIPFAQGKPATEAGDGFFEFMFNTNPSKKPKLKEDGSVDYYNLNLVEVVEKDTVIAVYHEKRDGIDGYNLQGTVIKAKQGRDLPPLRGSGFYVSDDGKKYYAEQDGKVELSMGRLIVTGMYTVSGSVDLSTGNIDFRGDLYITGNVIREMTVKATGNITIDGLVEAAHIEAGKGILIKGGILGGGKAVIKAGDNIYAMFIENSYVQSNNCVQADSIVNSNVTAYSDINVFGKTSCIIGGIIKANRYIKTKVIGSDKGIKTSLEVGVSNQCRMERKTCRDRIEYLEESISKMERVMASLAKAGKDKTEVYIQATRSKIELSAELYRLRSIIDELDKRIEIGKHAKIIAEKRIYPGSKICIDGRSYGVIEEFESIVFYRKEEKIVSKKYIEVDDREKAKNK